MKKVHVSKLDVHETFDVSTACLAEKHLMLTFC